MNITDGAKIVVDNWLKVKEGEKLLVITDDKSIEEAMAIKKHSEEIGALTVLVIVPEHCPHFGDLFDDMVELFISNDIIIGATSYSLITTNAVRQAIKNGRRYLSLPLSTNTEKSALAGDFMAMDTEEAREMAEKILPYINKADTIRVKNANGTDLEVKKAGRKASYFNGAARNPGDFASSSFEVYFAMEETKTNGSIILDGSFGYMGDVKEHTKITFKDGKIIDIEETSSGRKLSEYMKSFDDDGIYVAGEFGIGLNKLSKCVGNSYIEDESTYKTFHLGMGRNLALGGVHDAKGHFDLVFKEPDIYADGTLIIKGGEIIV